MLARMNYWTSRTVDLATNGDYLDRLLDIYPARLPPERPLPIEDKQRIIDLYNKGKYEELVILLIKNRNLPFPVEHPYAALLRYLEEKEAISIIQRNPKIIKELADLLHSLGLNNILRGIERPKDINRTLGAAFKAWVNRSFREAPFRVIAKYELFSRCSNTEICVYAGPDKKISEFIRNYLKLKEPESGFFDRDVIAKVKDIYVVGEARFLSTPGGSQSRDLDNTLKFVEKMESLSKSPINDNRVVGVALLDGIVWFYEPYRKSIEQRAVGDRVVMSALFLKEYLLELFKKNP